MNKCMSSEFIRALYPCVPPRHDSIIMSPSRGGHHRKKTLKILVLILRLLGDESIET